MFLLSRIGVFLTIFIFIHSCTPVNKKQSNHVNHWEYEGLNSPDHWAELSPEYIKCAEGLQQSPIDLETSKLEKHQGEIIKFNYHPSLFDLVNNGHTIQGDVLEENSMTVFDQNYTLKQVHFHSPAEHLLDGIIYPMEMHMVHQLNNGKLGVVGVFIKEGPVNYELQEFWDNLPGHTNEHKATMHKCNLIKFLPENHSILHYTGSLTTPPCSEGVQWFIMEDPIEMSKDQIKQFKTLYDHNNRPVQDQKGRIVAEFYY